MSFGWKKITANVWRLDNTWQVVQQSPGQWIAYRGDVPMLAVFPTVEGAMAEAELLKAENKLYERSSAE